jgi:hypothetical protein
MWRSLFFERFGTLFFLFSGVCVCGDVIDTMKIPWEDQQQGTFVVPALFFLKKKVLSGKQSWQVVITMIFQTISRPSQRGENEFTQLSCYY